MMGESFDLDAPQFVDFTKITNDSLDECDEYFEQNHEKYLLDPLNNSDYFSEVTVLADDLANFSVSKERKIRKSMSYGDLENLCESVHRLRSGKIYTHGKDVSGEESFEENSAQYVSLTSLNDETHTSNAFSNNHRTISKEFINRLAQPKKRYNSDQNLNKTEYVPMAEALRKFQNGTPKRFRSKATTSVEPLKCTVPQSPKLKTTVRSRPVYVLSYEEQERIAADDARRSQFRAHPVNKKILQPPTRPSAKGKRSTVPEPFNLTAIGPKKIAESPKKKQSSEFHARPVPKSVYEFHQPVIKAPLKTQVTRPHTPTFMKKYTTPLKAIQNKEETVAQKNNGAKIKPTKPLPFSFELRDKYLKGRRDQLVQKYVEAEKKAREFHAKPVPKSVLLPSKRLSSYGSRNNLSNLGKTKSEVNVTVTQFKAKPPTVLYKKPFEPKLDNKPMIETLDFNLQTDVRAKERENFEHYIKEKEEKLVLLREEEEMLRKRQEEEEIQRARKEAEFKAQEIRRYKELTVQPVKKITNPISPKFHTNKLRNTSVNKENAH